MTPIVGGLIEAGLKLIDKVLPDPQAKAEAKLKLLEMQQQGELKLLETQMSAIVAEAQSADPWTSRARPSFLYVMYAIILFSVPMGVISAVDVETAAAISNGMTAYLKSIPDPLYALFGTGYLGYTAARQWGKVKGVDK
jgi:hypothetical protein